MQGTSTAEQLTFPDDFSDVTMPPPIEEPTPMTTCPRCAARTWTSVEVENCPVCGWENYSGQVSPGLTPISTLADTRPVFTEDRETAAKPMRFRKPKPPLGESLLASMARAQAKVKAKRQGKQP